MCTKIYYYRPSRIVIVNRSFLKLQYNVTAADNTLIATTPEKGSIEPESELYFNLNGPERRTLSMDLALEMENDVDLFKSLGNETLVGGDILTIIPRASFFLK